MYFNFLLNNYCSWHLRGKAQCRFSTRSTSSRSIRKPGFNNFLRNLDELDLERLTESEREEVYNAFAPQEEMRIMARGIRRRLVPYWMAMRSLKLAFSLLFSLPGSPLLVYEMRSAWRRPLCPNGKRVHPHAMELTATPALRNSTAQRHQPHRRRAIRHECEMSIAAARRSVTAGVCPIGHSPSPGTSYFRRAGARSSPVRITTSSRSQQIPSTLLVLHNFARLPSNSRSMSRLTDSSRSKRQTAPASSTA